MTTKYIVTGVFSVAFHPYLPFLAIGSSDGYVILYNISVLPPTRRHYFHNYSNYLNGVVFHPTLPCLAICSLDTRVILYDISVLSSLSSTVPIIIKCQLQDHTNNIISVAFHGTLHLLATGSCDSTVILYDLTTSPPIIKYHFKDHNGFIETLTFHPRLPLLSSGSLNSGLESTIIVYNLCNYFKM